MSCIYGPHQHGNEDQGWVAHMARRALAGEAITIYGDGKQVRDVLFVEDLVDAFVLARRHIGKLSGRAFNIGGGPGNTVSLLELIRRLEELLERRVELSFDAWRVGDQRYYVSDTRKFAGATGWRAKRDVEQGLLALFDWFKGEEHPAQPALAPVAAAALPAGARG
jgi:CDP-paratose 2-epimerase